ncbi:MAG: TRIC cation channel family protein [Cyanobacteria bacterium P01_D01_bin.36]
MLTKLLAAGLTPSMGSFSHHLYAFDLLGTVAFASIGALVAYEQQRNGLSSLLYAGLTALGGGTIRDILLGQQPVFWMRAPIYLLLTLTAGSLTFVLAHYTTLRRKHFWLLDALSLAVFTIVGTQATLSAIAIPSNALFSAPLRCMLPPLMGLTTGMVGGLIRDVIANKTPYAMQHSCGAIASLTGGSLYLVFVRLYLPEGFAVVGALFATLLVVVIAKGRNLNDSPRSSRISYSLRKGYASDYAKSSVEPRQN